MVRRKVADTERHHLDDCRSKLYRQQPVVGYLAVVRAQRRVVVAPHANGKRQHLWLGADLTQDRRGFIYRYGSEDITGGAQLERACQIGDHCINLATGHWQAQRTISKEAVSESVDAITSNLGHSAQDAQLDVARNQRKGQNTARFQFGRSGVF